MHALLRKVITNTISISVQELEYMLSLFKHKTLKKEDYLLKIGKPCSQVFFVNEGVLRIYYPNDKGEDTTCYFALPNEFVTSFSSFSTGKLSVENIQAIIPTTVLYIEKNELELLYQKIPVTQEFGRKAAENLAIILEKRISLFLNNTADERYQFLIKHNPILIQTIPLQYLASYLGISPQHLSRLRKKL